jgi:predicted NAD-dependent protein-ADP-ribosyltransferase YbiA (DUF1768 family)
MSSVHDKYFECLAETPCISLPKWLVADVVAQNPEMSGFHDGELNVSEVMGWPFRLWHSGEDAEKMVAYVVAGDHAVMLFGRKGPTNFAKSSMKVSTTGGVLPVSCTEQLFMAHKACYAQSGPEGCSNFEECIKRIFLAKKPFQAKGVGRDVKGLDSPVWDLHSYKHMRASMQFACTVKETFERYQSFVTKCPPEVAKLIAEGKFAVYECNDDVMWGIGQFTIAALRRLAEIANRETDFDLKEAMGEIVGETLNRLGNVLTDFLLAIRDLTHAEYLQKLEGVTFFDVVEEEQPAVPVGEVVESPAHKRQCT